MGHPAALPLGVVAPIAGALLAPLAGRRSGRAALAIALAAMVTATIALAVQVPEVFGKRGIVTEQLGGFLPAHGRQLGITWTADGFGLAVALVTAAVGAILVLYALSELRDLGPHELGWLATLMLLLLAGVIGAALTADLLNLFVWFEVSALASYGLTAFWLERPTALEATFKMLVLTGIASFLVFVGVGLLYQAHGAVNIGQLHDAMRAGTTRVDVVACALLVAGFATKAGLVPFHTWLPDAHSAAPGPVSAVFSGLMVTLGIVGLVRTSLLVAGTSSVHLLGVLSAVGVVSGIVGAIAALGQDELKRLLAYDTISQMGIVIVAFATGTKVGVAAGTLHLVNHALFKSLLFLCTSAIIHVSGTDTISELGGMARRQPAIAVAFIVGVAALIGVPPLNGYASASLLETDLRAHAPLVYAGVIATEVLTIAALARATWLVFFRAQPRPARTDRTPNAGMIAGFGLLGLLSIGFGVAAPLLVHTVGRSASAALLAPAHTSAVILGPHARLRAPTIPYEFVTLIDVVTVVGMIAAGIAIAVWILRRGAPAPVRWIRALHTGRVQDDVAALFAGFVVVVIAVALAR